MTELLWALFLLLFVVGFQSTWLSVARGRADPRDEIYDEADEAGPVPSRARQPVLLSLSKGPRGELRVDDRRIFRDGLLSGGGREANQATGTSNARSNTNTPKINRTAVMLLRRSRAPGTRY